ncbi:carboxypeptidase-like regulatory domain-containing protein [Chryseobacterium cheonjiense]|uniref:Carboxypeptidase regulatory-like domain-containing protein n=1 Tax=Chryseobacterium cheonjiense TaxID=2728845 RepID=A0A7Y0A704_9FLAO|nr:carboxypeptidase-like regulatory domain-containing protein [Chryseobacterium cheonjiense]NML57870.1 carboxypeptidase regulatory-like domain-containing protein [Chryseobacterium cheonjiense]
MKIKLLFVLFTLLFINAQAQDYIFGKVTSEENTEISGVTVINIRTDERILTNRDGHFMISGRSGDELRFVKNGYERANRRINSENISAPVNITLVRAAALIAELEVKKEITGDIKIDSKNLNPPRKVEKLKSDLAIYMKRKSAPSVLASRPGEFVQPVTKGVFSIGKVKNKWDDMDLLNYLQTSLGEEFFEDLKIEKAQIQHFILYILRTGFERKNILKYGYVTDADLNRFKNTVLNRISAYKTP